MYLLFLDQGIDVVAEFTLHKLLELAKRNERKLLAKMTHEFRLGIVWYGTVG